MNRIEAARKQRIRRKRHIRKKIFGTPDCPRLSVFRSNRHMYVQVVDDQAGRTLASVSDLEKDLKTLQHQVGDAAKLGEELGKRLKKMKISRVVFDRNGYQYHGIVKAIADGARKAGIGF